MDRVAKIVNLLEVSIFDCAQAQKLSFAPAIHFLSLGQSEHKLEPRMNRFDFVGNQSDADLCGNTLSCHNVWVLEINDVVV